MFSAEMRWVSPSGKSFRFVSAPMWARDQGKPGGPRLLHCRPDSSPAVGPASLERDIKNIAKYTWSSFPVDKIFEFCNNTFI